MEEKECKNCKYFCQHYYRENIKYFKLFCGHCLNRKPSGHYRKTDKACEFWEEDRE